MRLRRRKFHITVHLQSGDHPVVLGFGYFAAEATAEEAKQLALGIADAADRLHRGGGRC